MNQKYRIVNSGTQQLFCDGCPVHVHRWQISEELSDGKRVLQLRLVNTSEKTVSGVWLRLTCMGLDGRNLRTLYSVPLTGLYAVPRELFGEDRILRPGDNLTASVRVTPERVSFTDGTSWNASETDIWCAFPAPVPVAVSDPDAASLRLRAKSRGVRSDYRFAEYESVWCCSCGLPNGSARTQCGYCGADKNWLRANMSAQIAPPSQVSAPVRSPAAVPAPVPAAVPVSPAPLPVRRAPVRPAPVQTVTVNRANPAEEKKSGAGVIIGAVLLVLAILAAVVFLTVKYLLPLIVETPEETGAAETAPYYTQAPAQTVPPRETEAEPAASEETAPAQAETQEPETEETAIASVPGVPDAETETERSETSLYNEAVNLMNEQNYAEAYEIFKSLGDFNRSGERAADCLYSMGVLAYNGGDLTSAWSYYQKLAEENPGYANAAVLKQCCCYSFGKNKLNDYDYASAAEWFANADGYSNSADLVKYCRYQLAVASLNAGDYTSAAEQFAALEDYSDSPQKYQVCLFSYAQAHPDRTDELTLSYLYTLIAQDYAPAQELFDSIFGWKVKIIANTGPDDKETDLAAVSSLDGLYLHIRVDGGEPGEKLEILMSCTMPDGTNSKTVILRNAEDGTETAISWKSLKLNAGTSATGKMTLKFMDADTGEEYRTITLTLG